MNRSACIDHNPCPSCTKMGRDKHGDNLGVYEDGHVHCFSCGYHTSVSIYSQMLERDKDAELHDRKLGRILRLPDDCKALLEVEESKYCFWLDQYDLTVKEIRDNLLLFSEQGVYLRNKNEQVKPLVVFPVYSSSNLCCWHGRSLSYPATKTKWVIKGNPSEIIHPFIANSHSEICTVCEDILSGIKIGRIQDCYPLFGKNVSATLLKYLSTNYSQLNIWLDFDAVEDMIRLKRRLEPYFRKVQIIVSPHDPKLYSTEEIREFLLE